MCFKKKNKILDIYDDRTIVLLASQELDILIPLIDNENLINQIKKIQDELKYLSPRDNEEVIRIDNKIRAKIGNIKISLTGLIKATDEDVFRYLKDIEVLIMEREAKELK